MFPDDSFAYFVFNLCRILFFYLFIDKRNNLNFPIFFVTIMTRDVLQLRYSICLNFISFQRDDI